MSLTVQLAKHLRDVHFGGNWTSSNLKDNLANVTWQQATTQVHSLNTIATLVYHVNYYISAVLKVFQGAPLDASDKYSFDLPPIQSEKDWNNLRDKAFADAETFTLLIEKLPEHKLWENFADEKYGSYYRNIQGIIEHTHYHLGQIALVKKILLQEHQNKD
ncbi:DUF1572 domain-containing protein [Pedobacter steynii]